MSPASNKIALFIDGANLYATAKTLGFDIDYKRLLKEFQSPRHPGARFLLHRDHRGSGIFVDPAADRLARLQRLHGRHQGHQGIHRRQRPPQGQGQHGHRARGRCDGACRACRPDRAVLRRRRFPLAGRSGAAPRRSRDRYFHDLKPAADDRRRAAPPGRRLHRSRRTAAETRPRPVGASDAARAAPPCAAVPAARHHHGAPGR